MLRQMNPNFAAQQQYQQQMMRNMQNGAIGMKQPNSLQEGGDGKQQVRSRVVLPRRR